MKHIRWQVLIALVGVAFLSVAVAFLALGSTTIERADYGGTYIEGVAGRPSAINPLFSQINPVDRDIASLVFTGLTRTDDTGSIQPDLATQWTISPDGLVYTFTLRSDVRWHDGVEFSAEDVLYTINAIQDPGFKGPPNLSNFWRTVAASVVNETTMRFQLTQPYAPFLSYTTIGILPAHILKDVPSGELLQNPFNRRPIGTGPFQVAETSGDSLALDANPNFYGTQPFLSRIQFKFYSDYESIFSAFARGEVEGISQIQSSYLDKASALDNLALNNTRLAGYSLIYLNLSKTPFQDKAVRQALLYALDRQRIINDLLHGQGTVAPGPIDPGSWAFDNALKPTPFDPEKAKSLLDNAGWKDSNNDGLREKGAVIFAFTLTTNDDPARVALANEIAKEWQAIGVQVAVQPVPTSLLVQNVLRPRQFDAVLYDWRNLSSDPDQYENWHETQIPNATNLGQNYSGLSDRDISEVLEAARKTTDLAKRAELYHQFQELFADRMPALLLFNSVYTYGVDTRVHGVQLAPMLTPSDRFRNVTQWYLKTKRVMLSMSPEEANGVPTLPRATVRPRPTQVAQVAPTNASPPTAEPVVVAATMLPTAPPQASLTPLPVAAASPSASPVTSPSAPAATVAAQCSNPSAIIRAPTMDSSISGLAEIRGTAALANMTYWKLEYRADAAPTFVQLYRSDQPINDSVISFWSTKTVPNGTYWLQLTVVDNTGNFGNPCIIRVNVAN